MRINNISLSWFRGAANNLQFQSNNKSVVTYGCNGSGKSTFVDAIEYVLNGGKIAHLSHEYSGKRQEKGLINTHKPANDQATVKITFQNDSNVEYTISNNGDFQIQDENFVSPESWDMDKILLRYISLSEFISSPKSSKYNTLLPLLGLHNLEVYAQNIIALKKKMVADAGIKLKDQELEKLISAWEIKFKNKDDAKIIEEFIEKINLYAEKHIIKNHDDLVIYAEKLKELIEIQLNNSNKTVRINSVFIRAEKIDIKNKFDALRKIDTSSLQELGSLIEDRLSILESSDEYAKKIEDQVEIQCPSCGEKVNVDTYKKHILDEKAKLDKALNTLRSKNQALNNFSDALKGILECIRNIDLKEWVDSENQLMFKSIIEEIEKYNLLVIKKGLNTEQISFLENKLSYIENIISENSKKSPPEVIDLNEHLELSKVALSTTLIEKLKKDIMKLKKTPFFLENLEGVIRGEIKDRTEEKISLISDDIQKYWKILHPLKPIEDIKLYMPDEGIKGIDISLKFYDVIQNSPRLTLSEGYRNSLALCIFLALSKQEESTDKPIILDDVVISFDREHRRQVIYLLQQEFNERQFFIFTHDREWFADLKVFLDNKTWEFKALANWESPKTGVTWSNIKGDLSDSWLVLNDLGPEKAVHDARAYLDIYLGIVAEKLRIKMPYIRGDKNDNRTAAVFLKAMINKTTSNFKVKTESVSYEPFAVVKSKWEETHQLLISDANRGTHNKTVSCSEAEALIESCEKSVSYFKCNDCKSPIWKLEDQGGKFCRCDCGKYKWVY